MAQIGGDNSGGRESNVELNLVPFIDLMSVCIIFLLVTAVWTQVSMIQLGSSIYGKKSEGITPTPPPRPEVNLRLDVKAKGYYVTLGRDMHELLKVGELYDETRLIDFMKDIKSKHPEKSDAMISVDDSIPYEEAIRGMDVLLNTGFTDVSVATTGGD